MEVVFDSKHLYNCWWPAVSKKLKYDLAELITPSPEFHSILGVPNKVLIIKYLIINKDISDS